MTNINDEGGGDPFARVAKATTDAQGDRASAGRTTSKDHGEHVAPAPSDAPALPAEWRALGAPASAWPYRDPDGQVLRWTLRFTKADGEKDIRPATLWREKPGAPYRWRLAGEPGRRPLYGLDRLAGRMAAPVLVVEGEKTADAAGERFPDYVVMTWPGGSNAVAKADFSPLQGRHVVVWPDADEPGRKAAQAVVRAATAAGALSASPVALPGFLPQGWDLADEWPTAFSALDAAALIADARRSSSPAGITWPYGFRMDDDGLWYDQPTPTGGVAPTWLAASFEVLGEARDPEGGGWSVVLRFKDRDGREKTVPISRGRLAGGGAEVRADLADAGLVVSPQRGKADKFAIALAQVASARRLTLVAATGWCGDRFVLPLEVIGAAGAESVLFTGEAAALHYRRAGTLERWRSTVAARAEGNSLLTFALSLAFLGPIMKPLEIEGGGVHFRGSSSCGKTTLAQAAGSVWGGGGPLGFAQTWRTTGNALEMVAYGHSDGLVVLDELALVSPEEAGGAAYMLAAGQAKARSRADGALRRRAEWRVAILSTGEIGLADHIRAGKKGERPMTGQELRLLDIGADAGAQMGVWEELHGADGPGALSDAIKAACGRDYGHAGPAFLERFIARRAEAVAISKEILAAFLKSVAREGDSGQAHRAALRFGAVAVAGELAALFGVVPWPPDQAAEAARRLYARWAANFGRDAPREDREILRRLKGVIESERSAFAPLGDDDTTDEVMPSAGGRDGEARAQKTHGYRHVRGAEVRYLFHDEGWGYVFRGFNLTDAAKVVDEAGYLERDGEKRRLKKRWKARGEAHRLYTVRASILDAELGD